jgi:hypothetical protein
MKKAFFFIITSFLVSCNNNDATQNVSSGSEIQKFQNAWLNADLEDVFTTNTNTPKAFLFSKTDLLELLNTANFNDLKFVLGLTENKLDIKLSVLSGTQVKTLNSEIYSNEILETQLNNLNSNDFTYVSDNSGINNYFINNSIAYNQYKNFAAINNISVFENTVSYNGERIKHFSIERQVIEELINNLNFNKLAVVFTQNNEGKLSPIIVGLDVNNQFISSLTSNGRGGTGTIIIGGALPCPTHCD